MVPQMAIWQAHWDVGDSEDCSLTSSSPSNLKDEIDEFMYNMLQGEAPQADYDYQKLPNLLEQPLLGIASTSLTSPITRDEHLIKLEEEHLSISKNSLSLNPLDPSTSSLCPHGFHHDGRPSTSIAPPILRHLKQAYNQNLYTSNVPQQVPLKSELALPFDASDASSSLLFVPVSIPDSLYCQPFLDQYEDKQARNIHDGQCSTQPSNEALETSSNETSMPYLVCRSFTTSPTVPCIISTNSSQLTSSLQANHTSTISKKAFSDTNSLPLDSYHTNHLVDNSEIILPFTRTLATSKRISKGRIGEIDKVIKKKRKRTRLRKNVEELESQRMTHIAVERNRRRQINQHLNDLRSLMPSSYIQRGDQASIVGGAIRLVEELEQMLKSLHLQKQSQGRMANQQLSSLFLDKTQHVSGDKDEYALLQSSLFSVQVEITSLASILVKIMVPKRHNQLLRTLEALTFLSLKVIHLNITTLDVSILYSFHLKINNDYEFQTACELAKSIEHAFQNPKM